MADLIYGIHPVAEALEVKRRRFEKIMVSKGRRSKAVQEIVAHAGDLKIPVQAADHRFFQKALKGMVHQGVAAKTSSLPLVDIKTILKKAADDSTDPLIIGLDGVEDPQNLGSIVRSAMAMGVHGIVMPKVRSAPLSATVSKASSGAMEHMLFARVSNLVAALEQLKKEGLWIIGTNPHTGTPVDRTDLTMGMVLVVGGEGKGIRPLVAKTCDVMVSVPQHGCLDSLNAAVASAIVLYEAGRQRRRET
jgi:23S rRNA (guanosine2251-2'-O)-methyltransferase